MQKCIGQIFRYKSRGGVNLLSHIPCGGVLVLDDQGTGICTECGKVIKVRISNK